MGKLWDNVRELQQKGLTKDQICKRLKITGGQLDNARRTAKKEEEAAVQVKVDPTDARVMKLEGQVHALTQEKNDMAAQIKEYQKQGALFEAVMEEVGSVVKPLKPLNVAPIQKKNTIHKEDCVLHLSDEHMDEVVKPHSVQNLEDYDFQVAMRRAETLVEKTLNITQHTLANYEFRDLWILAYGDHTSGTIHEHENRSYYRNQFRNCYAIAQVHALMIRDLAPYFKNVHCVYVPGNHGRTTKKKDYNSPWNSWDYMIGEGARQLCKHIENVDFIIPESYSINVEIADHMFAIEHGDDIKSWNGIPYYGLERKTRRLISLNAQRNLKIDYFVYGHFHTASTLTQLGNSETIINGAWKATDPFVFGALSGFTEPTQWLHGVHPEHGITWRFKVKLRSPEEKKGPVRYAVDLASASPGGES